MTFLEHRGSGIFRFEATLSPSVPRYLSDLFQQQVLQLSGEDYRDTEGTNLKCQYQFSISMFRKLAISSLI